MLQLVFELRKTLDYPFAFFLLLSLFPSNCSSVDIVNGAGLAILSIILFFPYRRSYYYHRPSVSGGNIGERCLVGRLVWRWTHVSME
jgi:hypothetical protein